MPESFIVKVVIPVHGEALQGEPVLDTRTGIQIGYNLAQFIDSHLRGNDKKT